VTSTMEAPKRQAGNPTDDTEEPPEPDAFLRFANWVSEAMGRPTNIVFWFIAVLAWTFVFAFGGHHLASGSWLPAWFTSTGFNFPLNLITTVAELFIGFLVAAAANRSQTALTSLLGHIRAGVERDVTMEGQIIDVEDHLTELLKENTDLTKVVAANTASIDEVHARLEALCAHFGITTVPGPGPGKPSPS
jgi:low affinity Fe/Cu permease